MRYRDAKNGESKRESKKKNDSINSMRNSIKKNTHTQSMSSLHDVFALRAYGTLNNNAIIVC